MNRSGTGPLRIGASVGVATTTADTMRKQQKEIASLRDSQTKLETALAARSDQSKALNDQLQKAKLLAGLTAVRGSGIVLVLQDSKPPSDRTFQARQYLIHDYELQRAVNELYATGAEAVAINSQRLTSRSPIRCVGPTIQVNGVPLGSPFEIRAIGDGKTMASGLNMIGGVLEDLRAFDPSMVRVEQRRTMEVPAYTGSTEVRYAKPVMEASNGEGDGSRQ